MISRAADAAGGKLQHRKATWGQKWNVKETFNYWQTKKDQSRKFTEIHDSAQPSVCSDSWKLHCCSTMLGPDSCGLCVCRPLTGPPFVRRGAGCPVKTLAGLKARRAARSRGRAANWSSGPSGQEHQQGHKYRAGILEQRQVLLRRAQKPEPLRCQPHAYSEDVKLEEPLLFTSFQNYWLLRTLSSAVPSVSNVQISTAVFPPLWCCTGSQPTPICLERLLFFLTGRFSPELNSSPSPNAPGYCAAAGQWSPWQRCWAHRWTKPSSEATGTEQPTQQTGDFVRAYSARAHGKYKKQAFWDGIEGCLDVVQYFLIYFYSFHLFLVIPCLFV